MNTDTLYYIHDPMCSWCFAFAPAWQALQRRLPASIRVQRLLGGLAQDTDEPMPAALCETLQATWRRIEQRVPGIHFNFDFWSQCLPRRATYPACRAVIAARAQGPGYDTKMTHAIQQAYYQQARNPSDTQTLITLAAEIALDVQHFTEDLHSPTTQQQLMNEISQSRQLGADSFPALVLDRAGSRWPIAIDYSQPDSMYELITLLTAD